MAGSAQRVWLKCAWRVFDQRGHLESEELRITSDPGAPHQRRPGASLALDTPCDALLWWVQGGHAAFGTVLQREAMFQEEGKWRLSHRPRSEL